MLEEVEDAILFPEALDEGEMALLILDAVIARLIATMEHGADQSVGTLFSLSTFWVTSGTLCCWKMREPRENASGLIVGTRRGLIATVPMASPNKDESFQNAVDIARIPNS